MIAAMSPASGLLLSLALTLLPALAAAGDAAAQGEKTPLSREQIEQCLRDRQEVVASNRDLTAQKAQLDERSNALLADESRMQQSHEWLQSQHRELQAQQDELKQYGNDMAAYLNKATVVKKSADAYKEHVDRYNDEVRAHQKILDRYNADVAVLNAQLDQLDARARATDRRCVKAPVKRADLDAAKAAVEEKPRAVLTPAPRVIP